LLAWLQAKISKERQQEDAMVLALHDFLEQK
jgi:hypothetical protein